MKNTKKDLLDVAHSAFVEYGLSVLKDRALPDIKDGLKPVHRRILYGMSELNLSSGSKHKKSARVVGDILGKYHPHGDSSVYEAMVRMSQDFSMRYPLVDGQGNFGSVDGDGAAAMRYTEVRLTKIAKYMIGELKKGTTTWQPNYDGTENEPVRMPNTLPTLLMNGAMGIAVGLATNIPPHNINELLNAVNAKLDGEVDIYKYIKAPDFPTGGQIINADKAEEFYRKGRGSFIVRSKHTVNKKGDIVITEIPYGLNKAKLIINIAKLVKDKKIVGIKDIRDESSRTGMRIVIVLKKGISADVMMNKLYQKTQLQSNISLNFTALIDGQPSEISLDDMITHYTNHLTDIFVKTAIFEKEDISAKQHILEGRLAALTNIDGVIRVIKQSADDEASIKAVIELLGVSDIQAKAIITMRLNKLSQINADKITSTIAEYKARVIELDKTIANPIDNIKEHNQNMIDMFGDERRTSIEKQELLSDQDMVKKEAIEIILTKQGYIKRMPVGDVQGKGGTGKYSIKLETGDSVKDLITADTHQDILLFSNHNKVYSIKAFTIPETPKGMTVQNIIDIDYLNGEHIVNILSLSDTHDYILTYLKNGKGKITDMAEYKNINKRGKRCGGKTHDELRGVLFANKEDELLSISDKGLAIRMKIDTLRPMGRTAGGVKLQSSVNGVIMKTLKPGTESVVLLTQSGKGKRIKVEDIPVRGRGGKGMIAIKLAAGNTLKSVRKLNEGKNLTLITGKGKKISVDGKTIKVSSRIAAGSNIIKVNKNDTLVK